MKFPAINEDTASFDGTFQINVEEGVAGARGMEYVCDGTFSARSETMADCGSELDALPATLPDEAVDKRAGGDDAPDVRLAAVDNGRMAMKDVRAFSAPGSA